VTVQSQRPICGRSHAHRISGVGELSGETSRRRGSCRCNFSHSVDSWLLLVIVERETHYAAHAHYVGEDKCCSHARAFHMCTTLARTALAAHHPTPPGRCPPKDTRFSCPGSRGACRYAALASAWAGTGPRWPDAYDGVGGQTAWAWPPRGARRKGWLRRSRRAWPNIWRFNILRRLMCPSTGLVLQGRVTPALTAS
jgi:hypothetical protein